MVFGFLREARRREILSSGFPEQWYRFLESNVRLWGCLDSDARRTLCDTLRILIAEKSWEGCGGLEITEEIQVTTSAHAALLLIGIPHDYFPNVESILIYPTAFLVPRPRGRDTFNPISGRSSGPGEVVTESHSPMLGEAWSHGPVILSWQDILSGGQNRADGRNVVLHEFAHKLDLRDDSPDGVPRLANQAQYDTWAEVMSAEYKALVDDIARGNASLLNRYGATNAAEFFAVATECFFERGREMRETHSRLYEVMKGFYRQDPAFWT